MDTEDTFVCSVVHPRLFPAPFTDPGNPLKVRLIVKVGPDGLVFRPSAPGAEAKVLGSEPWSEISLVTIERLAASEQRMEVGRRSLVRMAVVGGLSLVFFLVIRSIPLVYSVLGALAVAAFIGALNFVLNGGLGRKQDVVRFRFTPSQGTRTFTLEVLPQQEGELRQALRSAAGARVEVVESTDQA